MAYPGIKAKIMNNGSKNIFVQFKYLSKRYPEKNFTKLFGCKTEKQAYEKLQEVKIEISKGRDPFTTSLESLNELYDHRKKIMLNKGEWRSRTAESYDYFYNRYIRKTIGYKKLSKIKYEDIVKLYDEDMSHVENSTKNQFKRIVRPIFVDAMKKGKIYENEIDKLKTYDMPVREPIDKRAFEDNIVIARKLYQAIYRYQALAYKQKEEIRNFLMLLLMTGHRHGELRQLRIEHCYLNKKLIIAPKTITKTKKDYHYPIPDECIEYLSNIKEGLIFPTLKRGSVDMIFQRLLKLAEIETITGKRLSPHDTRRLLLTIMIKDLNIQSVLADSCLSHIQDKTIKHYLSFTYNDIKDAYEKYWDHIRA